MASARKRGRPPIHDKPMLLRKIMLTEEQINWLLFQPEGMSATIRRLVDRAMKKGKR